VLIGTMKERVPMIKIFKSIAVASVAASLTACASPEVVDKRQMGDEQLSCMQLASEIQEAHEFERNAQKEKGITGKKAAAAERKYGAIYPAGWVDRHLHLPFQIGSRFSAKALAPSSWSSEA
jgi:hypothetical protein